MVCKLFITTCQTSINLLDNIYIIFLQHLYKKFGVQGIPQTKPAGPVLQGPVQGSALSTLPEPNHESGSGFRQKCPLNWTKPDCGITILGEIVQQFPISYCFISPYFSNRNVVEYLEQNPGVDRIKLVGLIGTYFDDI